MGKTGKRRLLINLCISFFPFFCLFSFFNIIIFSRPFLHFQLIGVAVLHKEIVIKFHSFVVLTKNKALNFLIVSTLIVRMVGKDN